MSNEKKDKKPEVKKPVREEIDAVKAAKLTTIANQSIVKK